MRIDILPKVNWSLAVLGRRMDGYHTLDMLMQTIRLPELQDTLILQEADALALEVDGSLAPDGEENLVMQAARLLREAYLVRAGARMVLRKGIPSGAGLGGGSADAAAALLGLCRLWGLSPSEDELAALALRLGADVPFFLRGGLARVRGIGEVITPLAGEPFWQPPMALVKPAQGLSTPEVFRRYDALGGVARGLDMDAIQAALVKKDLPGLAHLVANDLQPAAVSLLPQVDACIQALRERGALAACMTGSGSAVFGLFATAAQARAALEFSHPPWAHRWSG